MARSSPPEAPPSRQAGTINSSQANQGIPDISPELLAVLQRIVDDVVEGLGCVGAMVATMEGGNALPVRAYFVDIAPGLLTQLENRLGISFVSPRSVAYLDERRFRDNLSVRAIKGRNSHPEIVVSNELHDLFRPIVNKHLSKFAQRVTQIKQVIAVPFFLEDEVMGNLFAAAREEFSQRDIDFLNAFGHQAATAIQSHRHLEETQALESVIFDLQNSLTDENRAFKTITDAVVQRLGYVAAVVAPRIGNTLPVRAYTVDSSLIKQEFVDKWQRISGFELLGERAVAYLDREEYAEQLSVRAVKSGQIQSSSSLYDLIRPVIPKWPTELVQEALGIKRVIAVPFFLDEEAIGNLYVVSKRSEFSEREKELLQAFGQQAAIALHNARLYYKAEERRQAAEIFAKMAFSASASVHALRNHVGLIRGQIQLLQMVDQFADETRHKILESIPKTIARINEVADILDNLHEPWREAPDVLIDVNRCLVRAVDKVIPVRDGSREGEGILVHESLSENLPLIRTSPDMLAEAFKVLVKNAVEAVQEKGKGGDLWIESRLGENSDIEVLIRDSGTGIKPEDLSRIFEIRWTTKDVGMGFGLFWTKDYVEGLGGSIEVESAWQEGTTFRVSLPTSDGQTNALRSQVDTQKEL